MAGATVDLSAANWVEYSVETTVAVLVDRRVHQLVGSKAAPKAG